MGMGMDTDKDSNRTGHSEGRITVNMEMNQSFNVPDCVLFVC